MPYTANTILLIAFIMLLIADLALRYHDNHPAQPADEPHASIIRRSSKIPTSGFGLALFEARKTAGFTRQEFSLQCGLTLAHIGRLERGELPMPSNATLRQLATALGISVRDLTKTCAMERPALGASAPVASA